MKYNISFDGTYFKIEDIFTLTSGGNEDGLPTTTIKIPELNATDKDVVAITTIDVEIQDCDVNTFAEFTIDPTGWTNSEIDGVWTFVPGSSDYTNYEAGNNDMKLFPAVSSAKIYGVTLDINYTYNGAGAEILVGSETQSLCVFADPSDTDLKCCVYKRAYSTGEYKYIVMYDSLSHLPDCSAYCSDACYLLECLNNFCNEDNCNC